MAVQTPVAVFLDQLNQLRIHLCLEQQALLQGFKVHVYESSGAGLNNNHFVEVSGLQYISSQAQKGNSLLFVETKNQLTLMQIKLMSF